MTPFSPISGSCHFFVYQTKLDAKKNQINLMIGYWKELITGSLTWQNNNGSSYKGRSKGNNSSKFKKVHFGALCALFPCFGGIIFGRKSGFISHTLIIGHHHAKNLKKFYDWKYGDWLTETIIVYYSLL